MFVRGFLTLFGSVLLSYSGQVPLGPILFRSGLLGPGSTQIGQVCLGQVRLRPNFCFFQNSAIFLIDHPKCQNCHFEDLKTNPKGSGRL